MTDPAVEAKELLAALDLPGVATAVGIVEDDTVGTARSDDSQMGARFEFGSITKTMTAQVLATLVQQGILALDDTVDRWLNAGPNGDITLDDLARHCSGLPRMAPNAADGERFDELDPYATYTEELAEAALQSVKRGTTRYPSYSNFGFQLLGIILERASGRALPSLFIDYVFEPFGLKSASVGPHPKLVQGLLDGQPTPPWNIRLPGPGGVVGTIEDLLAWASAVAKPPRTAAGDALILATRSQRDDIPIGLAWQMSGEILWHNGKTSGFQACVAISSTTGRAAASLAGTSNCDHIDGLTMLAARGDQLSETSLSSIDLEAERAVHALVNALCHQDWEGARETMSPACRKALTAGRLHEAWAAVMDPRGNYRTWDIRTKCRRGPHVEVWVDLSFSAEAGAMRVTVNHLGEVVGVLID